MTNEDAAQDGASGGRILLCFEFFFEAEFFSF